MDTKIGNLRGRQKEIAVKFVIIICSIFIFFFIGEIAIRVSLLIKNKKSFSRVLKDLPKVKDGDVVTLGEMIRPSLYRKIIYELRSNLNVQPSFANRLSSVKTNAQGYRGDKNYLTNKENNTVRIIVLGDSYMFGQGISNGEEAPKILENELNNKFPQKRWEVINTAVPGYNTVMEVETLEKRALFFKPDIVIIEFIGNDFDLPNFIYETSIPFNLKKLYFIEFLKNRIKLFQNNFKLRNAPSNPNNNSGFANDPLTVPEGYQDMVGWKSYVEAMERLAYLKKNHHFEVVHYLTISYTEDRVFNLSKNLGFHVEYNRAFDYTNDTLGNDPHPSPQGHKKNAKELLRFLIQEGIIDKLIKDKDESFIDKSNFNQKKHKEITGSNSKFLNKQILYSSSLTLKEKVDSGTKYIITVVITNKGSIPWYINTKGNNCLSDVSCEWIRAGCRVYETSKIGPKEVFGLRFELPRDILPGEKFEAQFIINKTSLFNGSYLLKFDMVNELKFWFEDLNSTPLLEFIG